MIIDSIGWIGALLILIGYGLISFKKIEGNSLKFQLLNIFGSVFLAVNTYYYGAIPSTLVNVIWAIIAVFAIFAIVKSYGKNSTR
jgi:drug/metabolite transporter (DMT)-like permease